MPATDPLEALLYQELSTIDPVSELAHHRLRHCRAALEALALGERHEARGHFVEAALVRDTGVVDVGGRALTDLERSELARLLDATS